MSNKLLASIGCIRACRLSDLHTNAVKGTILSDTDSISGIRLGKQNPGSRLASLCSLHKMFGPMARAAVT